ncbi:thiamine phosphate synthase [Streptomyces sp. CAU 1734]|uniref:thiamine phosphate synthase n=1 Tax=Streptomyces sp. CAU 1734 TaxID=3140360 RepID=UPI0032607140
MDTRERLAASTLYLCTDARRDTHDLAEFADAAPAGGVDVIQLRDKGSAGEHRLGPLEAAGALEAPAVLRDACRRRGALLAVNDRADLAVAAGADVLHLGQGDLPLAAARRIVGDGVLTGRSAHSPGQVRAAAAGNGPDCFSVGPCRPAPTKPGRAATGTELLRVAAEAAGDRPWFAIGGIDAAWLPEVLAAGARRVAVVRAVTAAAGPRRAAAELSARLREAPDAGRAVG